MNIPTQISDAGFPTHGGELIKASRLSGLPIDEIIDFSVSVNPLGLPDCVAPLVEELIKDLGKYPDSESSDLKHILADILGVSANRITVTNGSTELIYFLPSLWKKNRSILCVNPCFSEYERAFCMAGIPVHEWALSPETSFAIDTDAFLRKLDLLDDLGGIVIGHPNNPTGTLCKRESLLSILAYCEKRDIYFVVDETFIEFAGCERSLINQKSKNLIQIQSLTKFYALPGLRLGYGITSPDLADRIRDFRPPWSVNTMAQKIGGAVLQDSEFKKKTQEYIKQERARMHEELSAIPSIETFPADANFLLFRLRAKEAITPSRLYQNLLSDGLLVRNCGNFKGLDSSYFRIAVNKRADNEFLISKLKQHLL